MLALNSHHATPAIPRGARPPRTPAAGQLAFFLDVVFEGQGVRVTRLDLADSLNDGAIRVTREARRRELPCLNLPVYRSMAEVVREAGVIARRKRPRTDCPTLPALALVYSIQPLRLHGRPEGPANPQATGTKGGQGVTEPGDITWDVCARSYTIVLVEALTDNAHPR
ncbi:MAG: hypothetical protein ACR2M1_08355 [Gemmatimonadaceae bacterium]